MQRYFVRPQYPFGQVLEKLAPGATAGYFERVNATVVLISIACKRVFVRWDRRSTVKDNKIVRMRIYEDTASIIAAIRGE